MHIVHVTPSGTKVNRNFIKIEREAEQLDNLFQNYHIKFHTFKRQRPQPLTEIPMRFAMFSMYKSI